MASFIHERDWQFSENREVLLNTVDSEGKAVAQWLLNEIFYGPKPDTILVVTGPPGVGKTTFIYQLVSELLYLNKVLRDTTINVKSSIPKYGLFIKPYYYDELYTEFEKTHGPDTTWTQGTRTAFSLALAQLIQETVELSITDDRQHRENPLELYIELKRLFIFEYPGVPVNPYQPLPTETGVPVSQLRGAPDRGASTSREVARYLHQIGYVENPSDFPFQFINLAFAADLRTQMQASTVRSVVGEMAQTGQSNEIIAALAEMNVIVEGQISVDDLIAAFDKMAPTTIIRQINRFIDEDIAYYKKEFKARFKYLWRNIRLPPTFNSLTDKERSKLRERIAYYLIFFEEVGLPSHSAKAVVNLLIHQGPVHIGGLQSEDRYVQ